MICKHGMHLNQSEWCGQCVSENLKSDIAPPTEIAKIIVAEHRREYRIHAEQLVEIEDYRLSYERMQSALSYAIDHRLIKSYEVHHDIQNNDLVITIEKL